MQGLTTGSSPEKKDAWVMQQFDTATKQPANIMWKFHSVSWT